MKRNIIITVLVLIACCIQPALGQPGCPGIDAGPNQVVSCASPCTTLNATYLATGLTSTYSATSIPYSPPFAFNNGTPIIVNIDDTWSSAITLPFNFCFYGTAYNQIIVGSNGLISFDVSGAGGYCNWSFTDACPSANLPLNAIFGVYEDIDPTHQGLVNWQFAGTYPCRMLVVSYYQVPYYGDQNSVNTAHCQGQSLYATSQIVLYESTNVIEVYVKDKEICTDWNSGNGLIGIQNSTGTLGIAAPGRNTSQWTAHNEAWRFTPNGPANYTVTWWNGSTQIGTGASVMVCPSLPTTYTAQIEYDVCSGNNVIVTDQATVTVTSSLTVTATPSISNICPGGNVSITASASNPNTTYQWSGGAGTGSTVNVSPAGTTTYTVTGTDNNGCQGVALATVNVNPGPVITVSPASPTVCYGTPVTITASGAINYIWSPSTGLSGTSGSTVIANPTSSITYTLSGIDSITTCSGSVLIPFMVIPLPVINAGPDTTICNSGAAQLHGSGGLIYQWSPSTGLSDPNIANPIATPAVTTTYILTASAANGSILLNGDFQQGNVGFYSDYTYSATVNNESYYYITPNPNSWHGMFSACPDHTTGTGNMMVVNGSSTPNTSVWCETVNVTPNTDYAFSCWLESVYSISPAILQFSINGVLLGTPFNASSTVCQWNQFYSLWNSGSNTTATICIVNQNTALSGNDFAIDDISFSPLCEGSDSVTVTVANPTSSTSSTDVYCYNGSDGTATVTMIGGMSPYYYIWSTSPVQNTQTATGLSSGIYMVTVTDGVGCVVYDTVSIGEPTELVVDLTGTTPALCFGGSTGSATVSVSGGTIPYSYAWSYTSSTGPTAVGFPAGNYFVTVTDDNNCQVIVPFSISQPPQLVLNMTPQDEGCLNNCDGSILAGVSGGIPPYSYQWSSTSSTANQIDNLCAGNYSLTVTDSNNCTVSINETIGTNTFIEALADAFPPTGVVPLTVNFHFSGSGATTYQWNFGDGDSSYLENPTHVYTADGIYTVTLTVNSGYPDFCEEVYTIVITVILPSTIFVPNIATPNNDGSNDVFKVKSQSLAIEQMTIFNRWGRKVFAWDGVGGSWDCKTESGGEYASGTYFWVLYARGNDGIEYNLNGTLTVLR
jgi:large repetitive protein